MPRKPRRRPASPKPAPGERRLLQVLRALGDGTRLRLYRRIAAGTGPVCVRDLAARLPVSQPTISHHLRVLREAGLVTVARRGTWSWIAPDAGGLDAVRGTLAALDRRAKAQRGGR